jgi:hypothetical protein
MGIGVKSSINDTKQALEAMSLAYFRATTNALRSFRDYAIKYIVDNQYWSNSAVYKGGPQKGRKYDLNDSGNLLKTISNPHYNNIVKDIEAGTVTLGIGNIEKLDALKTNRENVSNPDFSYWRVVVYGRDPIPGWKFVPNNQEGKKARGFSRVSPDEEIASSEPTHMFHNGMQVAEPVLKNIVINNLRKVSKGLGEPIYWKHISELHEHYVPGGWEATLRKLQ